MGPRKVTCQWNSGQSKAPLQAATDFLAMKNVERGIEAPRLGKPPKRTSSNTELNIYPVNYPVSRRKVTEDLSLTLTKH